MTDRAALLARTAEIASAYLANLDTRPVGGPVDLASLRTAMGGPLPAGPSDPLAVVESLAASADAGIVASAGPRFFGFVVGGSLPAALAADWLASTWDQNAGLYVLSPAAAVAEEVAGAWLVELLELPPTTSVGFVVGGGLPAALAADWLASAWDQNAGLYVLSPAAAVAEEVAGAWLVELLELPAATSVGFVTGATMANFTALAAARHAVLARTGWDVERQGLQGAPNVTVITHEGTHVTVYASLQMLGLGREGNGVRRIASDDQGRMRPDALGEVLAGINGPTIVCAQAGNVNSGAFDPFEEIVAVGHDHGAWVHIDGAFGIWAAAVPSLRGLMRGHAGADSWSTDAHKWLNVPYDSGLVFVRDADAHHAAMTLGAAYYVETAGAERDPYNWVPESSRRARGFAVLAALRSLGRSGLVELIERDCALARRMAERLAAGPRVSILNEVVLNQVLVRFEGPEGEPPDAGDARTKAVVDAVQRDGTLWLGGTTWAGRTAIRVSLSGWQTTADDIDRSAATILACAEAVDRAV
jgi:glutamate/tyrosine decarboxylase-like PLP-dependent enzyme